MHTPLPFHSGNFPVSGSNDCQRVSFASNRSSCIPCRSAHMTLSRSKIDERKLVVAARVLDDHRFLRAMACISQNAMPTIAFVSESTQW